MTDIKRVGVLGCGLMGSGIAQVAATAGYDTTVRDVSQQIWDKARAGIEKSLAKFVEKGKLPAADRDAVLKRLHFTTATPDLKTCDVVVEAVTEDLELKNALWRELDGLCGPAAAPQTNGPGRDDRPEERQGLLRLFRRSTEGARPRRLTPATSPSPPRI